MQHAADRGTPVAKTKGTQGANLKDVDGAGRQVFHARCGSCFGEIHDGPGSLLAIPVSGSDTQFVLKSFSVKGRKENQQHAKIALFDVRDQGPRNRLGRRLDRGSQSSCVTLSDLIENPDPYASSLATWVWMAIFMRHPRRFEWGAGSH